MFGEDVTVNMVNTGGDVWTADIPGQDAGTLVRYRIDSDVAVAPFAGDTINYLGVVVQPTDIVNNALPVFQFFVDEAEFLNLTTTDLALTNTKISAVVVYGGQVIDNATVRVRGGDFSRINYPKKSLKFELPDGYTLDFGTGYGVDEFGVNADYSDWTFAATDISWDVWNAESQPHTNSFNLRVENNAQFHGVFRFQELYDGGWREFNGFKDDEFFKADLGGFGQFPGFDKKSPDDDNLSSITEINDVLFLLDDGSEAKRAWLYENVNVPALVNHRALSAMTRHDDQDVQNFYMARDAESGLWERVEWDLDRLWIENEDSATSFTDVSYIDEPLMNAIFAVPEFESMYWRRMQTLADTYLSEDGIANLIARREELIQEIGATNSTLEFDKWGRVDIFISDYFRQEWNTVLQARAAAFAAESRMPGTASGSQNIVITELHYNPAGDDAEFIELFNNSNESIDLSGWSIDGIGLTVEYGTVILPNQYIVFTDNMPQFRNQYPGNIFVGGQYSGGLSGGGEAISLINADGTTIDYVVYDDTDPWPTAPDGNGNTLSLIDVTSDNNVATNWEASSQINGTPGQENSAVINPTVIRVFAADSEGDEQLSLDLFGQRTAVFDLASAGGQAGDLAARNFTEFTFVTSGTVSPNDVRVSFLNDSFDPVTQTGRDLAIDRIEIDGVIFETEDPSVFSTGSYSDAGLVPGFLETEILQTNGYFQYGEPVEPDPSLVKIRAAGSTGNEIITLEISGTVVATYDLAVLGGQAGDLESGNFLELTYQSDGPVDAADVRINFVNDVYDPANGIDYNVAIDNIRIGDVTFETEAPTTYSTGTWLPEIGVVPGFTQSELLSNAGYFQYLFDPTANNNPVATNDSYSTDFQTPVGGNLLANDSDPDLGDTITVIGNTVPANGLVNVSSNGQFVYTPNESFSGTDSFTYTISDGNGGTDNANVVFTVEAGSPISNGNIVQFRNVGFSNSYLATYGSGEAITQPTNNSQAEWRLIDTDGDGRFYIQSLDNGRYLDGDNGGIDTSNSTSGSGKLWEFIEINPGQYHLSNVSFNRILDANGTFAFVDWDPGASETDDLWTVTVI